MKVWTCQMARYRKIGSEVKPVDITVKSGLTEFAPTWSMLRDYKSGLIEEDEYTELFYEKMRQSYATHRGLWDELLSTGTVALMCYCKGGEFCHRLLMVDILKKVATSRGVDFEYCGEIE